MKEVHPEVNCAHQLCDKTPLLDTQSSLFSWKTILTSVRSTVIKRKWGGTGEGETSHLKLEKLSSCYASLCYVTLPSVFKYTALSSSSTGLCVAGSRLSGALRSDCVGGQCKSKGAVIKITRELTEQ